MGASCCAAHQPGDGRPGVDTVGLVVARPGENSHSRQSRHLSQLQSSFEEQDVEIVEMQLDNTNRSMDEKKRKLASMRPSKFDKDRNRIPSSTNDYVDFSSIRDMQDHEIFTSDRPTKQAKIRLDNGALYEGEWLKGQRHGFGKLTWPNGSVYEVLSYNAGRVVRQPGQRQGQDHIRGRRDLRRRVERRPGVRLRRVPVQGRHALPRLLDVGQAERTGQRKVA